MILKGDVDPQGIRPELNLALMVAESVFARRGIECVITSLTDGKHSRTSLHYSGCAADLRIRHMPREVAEEIAQEIDVALPNDQYDVIMESTHLHIEYQPKR